MHQPSLSLLRQDGTALILLQRPELGNRIDRTLLEALFSVCRTIADDDSVRAVVLASRSAPFSLGWDRDALAEEGLALVHFADAFDPLARLEVPVIAAIEGLASGAGAELALACDLRVAGHSATLAFPELELGLIPMAGGTQRLVRLAGRARALEWILWGEPVPAAEAHRAGLVNRVVLDGEAQHSALALAERIASRGPLGVRYTKEAILRGAELPLEQGLRLETDLAVLLQTTEDRDEGVRAFLEKRPPEFRGT